LFSQSNPMRPVRLHVPNVADADAKAPLYSAEGPVRLTLSTTAENLPVTCLSHRIQ
jgi:hypothetical protein